MGNKQETATVANAITNGTGEVAPDVNQARQAARFITGASWELGQGFLSLSVAVAATSFAIRKFHQAWLNKP